MAASLIIEDVDAAMTEWPELALFEGSKGDVFVTPFAQGHSGSFELLDPSVATLSQAEPGWPLSADRGLSLTSGNVDHLSAMISQSLTSWS